MVSSSPTDALEDLGFTGIEALVYACLLRESPATGYRISHVIGRPTPNTYKAIASLAQKGAVVIDDGESRLCRAVPPDEVLTTLERRFQERKARARASLHELVPVSGDDRVYQMQSSGQVLERARTMLGRARRVVLVDVFPGPFRELRGALERAAKKARVVAKVYEECEAAGVEMVAPPDPERIRTVWPGQHVSIVRDGEEHLLALLSEDLGEVRQGVWSCSTFLSCMHHNHLASELMLTDLVVGAGKSGARSVRLDHEGLSLTTSGASGLKTLINRFGARAPKKGTR